MSPINTEYFIAPSSADTARATAAGFSTEQTAGESFGEHLRQAFETDASAASSARRSADKNQQSKNAERAERTGREREDSETADAKNERQDDAAAEDSRAAKRSEAQDASAPHAAEASGDENSRSRADGDQTPDAGENATETMQSTAPLDGAELVEQLIAENAQQDQQAQLVTQHYADQQLSNADIEQSLEAVENLPQVEAALQSAVTAVETAQNLQSQNDPTTVSNKTVGLPIESQTQVVDASLQNSEQNPGGDLADAGTATVADETVLQTDEVANTAAEQLAQDPATQVQVSAEAQQKERRASDRIETDAAADASDEKVVEGDAQAAVASTTTDRDQFKAAQKAVDTIAAVDSADTDSGDAKASSNQPGQNDISLAQRAQSTQDARTAAASGTAEGEEIDTVDRVRFVQRVARAVEGAGRDGRPLRIRLHPSELGSLRLEVTIRDGALTARMETETQAAKNILLDSLPALRDRLAQQDIKVQQFDIDYAGGNNDGSARNEADQHQAHDRSADRSSASRTSDESETTNEETQAAPRPRRLGGAAQLDFVA